MSILVHCDSLSLLELKRHELRDSVFSLTSLRLQDIYWHLGVHEQMNESLSSEAINPEKAQGI